MRSSIQSDHLSIWFFVPHQNPGRQVGNEVPLFSKISSKAKRDENPKIMFHVSFLNCDGEMPSIHIHSKTTFLNVFQMAETGRKLWSVGILLIGYFLLGRIKVEHSDLRMEQLTGTRLEF